MGFVMHVLLPDASICLDVCALALEARGTISNDTIPLMCDIVVMLVDT